MGNIRGWMAAAVLLAVVMLGCRHPVQWEDLEPRFGEHDERISNLESGLEEVRSDVSALRQELEQLRDDFDAHEADTLIHAGMRLALPIHFDFDRFDLRDVDRPILDRFAMAVMRTFPEALITLEGFTDPAGSEAYNMRLGRQRAESVKNYLVEQHGMNANLIRTVSFGELRARQVNPGAMGPGHSGIENRRVSFVVEWAGREGEIGQLQGERHGS